MSKRCIPYTTLVIAGLFLMIYNDLWAQRAIGSLSYHDDSLLVKQEFNEGKSRMLYNQGVSATQSGDYRLAVEYFTRSSEQVGGFSQAIFNRGVANLKMNNTIEAMLDFAEAIQADPRPEYYLSRCLMFLQREDTASALSDLQRVLADEAASGEAMFRAAMLQYSVGELDGARSTLTHLLANDSANPNLLNALAEVMLAQGDKQGALGQYLLSLQSAPQQTEILVAIGQLHYQLNALEKAEATFREVLHFLPDHPIALNGLSLIYLLRDIPDTASFWSDQALDAETRDPAIWNTRGMIAWKYADYEKAETAFSMAISLEPAQPVTHYNRALVRVMLRNDAGACEDFAVAAAAGLQLAQKGYRESCE